MTSINTLKRIAVAMWSLFGWITARLIFALITLIGMAALNSNLEITPGIFAEDYKFALVHMGWALLVLFLYKPFLSLCDRKPATELSIDKRSLPHFAAGVVIALVMLALPVLTLSLLGRLPLLYPTANSLLLVTAMALEAAIIEEIVFRGFLLQLLLKFLHPVFAIVIVALAFTASHLDGRDTISLVSVFFGGLTMTVAYFVARSLWLPIGIHFGWDFVLFAMKYFPAVIPNSKRVSFTRGLELELMLTMQVLGCAVVVTAVVWKLMQQDMTVGSKSD